jgi:hypothetical protein
MRVRVKAHLLFALAFSLATVSCKDKLCRAGDAPAAFKDYSDVFPPNAVICDPSWTPDGSPPRSQPNGVHMYFKDKTPHEAWLQMVDDLERKAWRQIGQSKAPVGGDVMPTTTFKNAAGATLQITINKTANGTHCYLSLGPKS